MLPVLRDRIQEIERSLMKNARYFQMAHGSEKCFQPELRKRTSLGSFLWKVSVKKFSVRTAQKVGQSSNFEAKTTSHDQKPSPN